MIMFSPQIQRYKKMLSVKNKENLKVNFSLPNRLEDIMAFVTFLAQK